MQALIALTIVLLALPAAAEGAFNEAHLCRHQKEKEAMGFQVIVAEDSLFGLPCELWLHPDNDEPVLVDRRQDEEGIFFCARNLKEALVNFREGGWRCAPAALPIPNDSFFRP